MTGKLTITRFNGVEVYSVTQAVIVIHEGVNAEPDEDGEIDDELQGLLHLYVATDPKPLECTTDDTIAYNPHPTIEIYIQDEVRLEDLVGREFTVEDGEDVEREELVSRFYYFEHEPLNNNRIEIVAKTGPKTYTVRWTGSCTDPNHYDGSKDDATIEIEAVFTQWVRGDAPFG